MGKPSKNLREAVQEKLKLVLDPELGISIWDLGLIYEIIINKEGICAITMTLTRSTVDARKNVRGIPHPPRP